MFSRKKIAAVSGLIGGLVMTCTGIAQAHAAGGPGTCSRDQEGTVTCSQHIKARFPKAVSSLTRRPVCRCSP